MKYLIKNIESFDDDFYGNFYSQLNKYQKGKIDKLKNIKDKKLSMLGMILIALELKIPIREIHYCKKKPYVNFNNIYFSITHKYPYVGIVVANFPVGIDLEILRDIDYNTFGFLGCNNNLEIFIKWTRKESFFKKGNGKEYKFKTIIINKQIIFTICM